MFGPSPLVALGSSPLREVPPRVDFGRQWVRRSVIEVYRENIARYRVLIAGEGDLVFCGEAESEPEALERIARVKPDVAVVDLVLKQGTGLSLIGQIRRHFPHVKTLAMSTYDQAEYVARAIAEGAHGYVTKDEASESLVEAIRAVMEEKFYLSRNLAARGPGIVPGPAHRGTGRHLKPGK